MKKTVLTSLLALVFCGASPALEINSQTIIHLPPDADAEARYAANELQQYIAKSSGARLKIAGRGVTGPNSIELRYDSSLASEEWSVRADKGKLIFSGGKARGLLYGVYDFLEKKLGVRFLDETMDKIVRTDRIVIADNMVLTGKPDFFFREIYDYAYRDYERCYQFRTRLKLNRNPGLPDKFGSTFDFGSPRGVHSMFEYTQDAPLEYCYMNKSGKRVRAIGGTGPGNVCFSNDNAVKFFAAKLAGYIAEDRRKAAARRVAPPILYDISINDNSESCYCPQCRALAAKTGIPAMAIRFVNEIAKIIEKEYPSVIVETLVYGCLQGNPGKIEKLNKNVMLRIAQLGPDFGGGQAIKDTMRPLKHPLNKQARDIIIPWSETTDSMMLWDYLVLFREDFMTPYANLRTIGETMRSYAALKVKGAFLEAENNELDNRDMPFYTSFMSLRNYLYAKTMENLQTDTVRLAAEFISDYYGPAAPEMQQFLDEVERGTAAVPGFVVMTASGHRAYLNAGQMLAWDALMSRAEAKCTGQEEFLHNVRIERIMVDSVILNKFDEFLRDPAFAAKWKLSREELFKRFISNIDVAGEKFYPPGMWARKRSAFVESQQRRFFRAPVPERFRTGKVTDFIYADINKSFCVVVPDSDAVGEHALELSPVNRLNKDTFHRKPLTFGIYDSATRQSVVSINVSGKDLPQDEKYHFYHLGRVKLAPTMRIWAHWSWHFGHLLKGVYNPIAPDMLYDIYLSIKVQGPDYVKGSSLPSAMRIDRIIIVEKK